LRISLNMASEQDTCWIINAAAREHFSGLVNGWW